MLNESGAPKVDPDHPWLGLSSFNYATRDYFFGRTAEIKEIYQRVTEHPLTVLYGQAGYGKTSLLGAGLKAKLIENGYLTAAIIRLNFDRRYRPLGLQLCRTLDELATPLELRPEWHEKQKTTEAELVAALEFLKRTRTFDGELFPTLWEYLHEKKRAATIARLRPVIILDQFEEIFTLGQGQDAQALDDEKPNRDDMQDFFTQLADVIENRPPAALEERFRTDRALARQYDLSPSPLRVVLTLREDYLSHLEAWKKTMPSLMRNRMALKLLSGPQALEAVVKPGRLEGRNLVSDEVGAQIVRFVAKRDRDTPLNEIEAVPPLLSLLCDELNTARLNHKPEPLAQITAELVAEQGTDILQNFYTRCFEGYPPELRHFVEDRLLTTGGHRIPVAHEDAVAELGKHRIAPEALTTLVQRRLLTQEERGGLQRLEIVHDKIAELAVASRNQRKEREAKERAEREAREAHDREAKARKERRRLRLFAAAMVALMLVSIGAAVEAFHLWGIANTKTMQLQGALKAQKRLSFEAVCRNAEADDAIGESAKVIENLAPYIADRELATHERLDKAKHLVEKAEDGYKRFAVFAEKVRTREKNASLDLGQGVTLDLILIPEGKFLMGSRENEKGRSADEKQHEVTISKPFYMAKFHSTQEQYQALTDANPSYFQKTPTNPVESVSWIEAMAFCEKLNRKSGQSVLRFTLPTEAQWEYACRGGMGTRYYFGDDDKDLDENAWYLRNAGVGSGSCGTKPVGGKKPNPFGLYDMHGNVFEWCADWYDSKYYFRSVNAVDPTGPEKGEILTETNLTARVIRGGSFNDAAPDCRSAYRFQYQPDAHRAIIGFRVVLLLDR